MSLISVNDLAAELDIPKGTLRRYLRQHGHLLNVSKSHKSYMVSEESAGILKQIREGYAQGLSSEEVEKRVLGVDVQNAAADAVPPASGDSDTVVRLMEAISNLEIRMLERLAQQDQLLKALAESAAALQPADPETQRAERVNARLKEWRIEKKLESEALAKWAELPHSERTIRTSLFRREENADKRERFVREYVDKHIDEELRSSYGL